MLGSAIIVLRETLEAALVIGILFAAVGSIARAKHWIAAGIAAGLVGAGVVALFAEAIASALAGAGQEYFNASVLFLAAAMLTWHQIWMKSHGRELAKDLRATGEQVSSGNSSLAAVGLVVALAVMREGSEVVLFLYGIAIGGADGRGIFIGGLLGLGGGVVLGVLIYSGLARIPQQRLFAITGWLLTLLAAGMASQGAQYLTQVGMLPALVDPLWNTSSWLPEHQPIGQLLHVLIGYNERPSGVQMLFFVLTIVVVVAMTACLERRRRQPAIALSIIPSVAITIIAGMTLSDTAHASHKVYSPIVEQGEYAIELRGHVNLDGDAVNRTQQYKAEFEHAPTARWLTELVGEFENESGESLKASAIEWENIFQLTEQGEHWLDFGVLGEYSRELSNGARDKIALGALFEKSLGSQIVNLNLTAERQLGGAEQTELGYVFRWRWRRSQAFEPGIEIFGELGDAKHLRSFADQVHSIGPGFAGSRSLRSGRKLRYEAAYLFGLSRAAPNGTPRLQIEYEF